VQAGVGVGPLQAQRTAGTWAATKALRAASSIEMAAAARSLRTHAVRRSIIFRRSTTLPTSSLTDANGGTVEG